MAITCLIGCDPAVTVRPFWIEQEFTTDFLRQLAAWGDLGEIQLVEGESVLKISRHLHEGGVFTWMGLYFPAKALDSERRHTFIGTGFLLRGDEMVPGATALAHLDEALSAFAHTYAPNGQLTRKIAEISLEELPPPKSKWMLDAAVTARPDSGGLTPRADAADGGVLFVDLARHSDKTQMATFVDRCQINPVFEPYHTLLMGKAPDPAQRRMPKSNEVVSPEELLNRRPPPPPEAPPPGPYERVGSAPDYWNRSMGGDPRGHPTHVQIYGRGGRHPPEPLSPDAAFYRGVLWGLGAAAIFFLLLLLLDVVGFGSMPEKDPGPPESQTASDGNSQSSAASDSDSEIAEPREIAEARAVGARFFDLVGRSRYREAAALLSDEVTPVGLGENLRSYYGRLESPRARLDHAPDMATLPQEVGFHVTLTSGRGERQATEGSIFLRRSNVPGTDRESWTIVRLELSVDAQSFMQPR